MDDARLSASLVAYSESFAEPDDETTSRMRDRVTGWVGERRRRRARIRRWLAATGVLALALGTGLGGYWFARAEVDPTPALLHAGEVGQRVELPGVGAVELAPGASVRLAGPERPGALELVEGEVGLDVSGPERAELRCGAFTVEAHDARLRVRRTASLPIVTVSRGQARLSGPDLPAAGVVLSPLGN